MWPDTVDHVPGYCIRRWLPVETNLTPQRRPATLALRSPRGGDVGRLRRAGAGVPQRADRGGPGRHLRLAGRGAGGQGRPLGAEGPREAGPSFGTPSCPSPAI